MTKILVRYGELGLKSERVQRRFLKRLTEDISDELADAGIDHLLETERGRIFIECGDEGAALEVLRHVSGVFSMSVVTECPSEFSELMECLREFGKGRIRPGMSYGLKVKRMGTQPYSSKEIAINGGGAVVSHLKEGEARVNLENPDVWIEIEIRENRAYVFTERVKAVGGMPSGTQGRVLLYLPPAPDPETAKRAALSYWMLSRRGCTVIPALPEGTEGEWTGPMELYRIHGDPVDLDPNDIRGSLAAKCVNERAAGIAYPFDAGSGAPDPSVHPRDRPLAEFYPTSGLDRSELDACLERFS